MSKSTMYSAQEKQGIHTTSLKRLCLHNFMWNKKMQHLDTWTQFSKDFKMHDLYLYIWKVKVSTHPIRWGTWDMFHVLFIWFCSVSRNNRSSLFCRWYSSETVQFARSKSCSKLYIVGLNKSIKTSLSWVPQKMDCTRNYNFPDLINNFDEYGLKIIMK